MSKASQNFLGRHGALATSRTLIDPLTGVPRVLEEDGCVVSSEKETSSIEKKKSKDTTPRVRAVIPSDSDHDSTSVGDVIVEVETDQPSVLLV